MHDDSPNDGATPTGEGYAAAPAGREDKAEPPPTGDPTLDFSPPIDSPSIPVEALARSRWALRIWFGILVVFGVGGLALGQQELALLVAVSVVIIAAHAADFHRQFKILYRIVSIVLVALCGFLLIALAGYFHINPPHGIAGTIVPALSAASGLVMLATGVPAVAMRLAHAMFGARGDSHSYRLAARLTLFGFLVGIPGWYTVQPMLEHAQDMNALFENLSLGGAVFGYVIVALASVGFLMRRDLRSTLDRLGIGRLGYRNLAIIAIGVPFLWGLNTAGEWGQRHWFPALAASDQRINEALAGALDRRAMIGLALTAGIGEEITMRGALQPKLGLVLTSLFFAVLHVQYSWYGMALICLLGMVLGVIRRRSNTTTAMAVHAIYDLLALLAT